MYKNPSLYSSLPPPSLSPSVCSSIITDISYDSAGQVPAMTYILRHYIDFQHVQQRAWHWHRLECRLCRSHPGPAWWPMERGLLWYVSDQSLLVYSGSNSMYLAHPKVRHSLPLLHQRPVSVILFRLD